MLPQLPPSIGTSPATQTPLSRTRDESKSSKKPFRSEATRDGIAAKVCMRVTKVEGSLIKPPKPVKPKAFRLIQNLDASLPLSIDAVAKLAILKPLLQIKKLAIISGAETSVNAGIPSFRTLRKSYRNPFDISAYNNLRETERFHALINNLSNVAARAKPTFCHQFLNKLARGDRLLRLYTQNIDCIEFQLCNLRSKTVQLHGRVDQIRCQSCNQIVSLSAKIFCGSDVPDCSRCWDMLWSEKEKVNGPLVLASTVRTWFFTDKRIPTLSRLGRSRNWIYGKVQVSLWWWEHL